MNIPVRIEPWAGSPAPVAYRWDEDTDILTAQVGDVRTGRSLSVDVEGSDGSWREDATSPLACTSGLWANFVDPSQPSD